MHYIDVNQATRLLSLYKKTLSEEEKRLLEDVLTSKEGKPSDEQKKILRSEGELYQRSEAARLSNIPLSLVSITGKKYVKVSLSGVQEAHDKAEFYTKKFGAPAYHTNEYLADGEYYPCLYFPVENGFQGFCEWIPKSEAPINPDWTRGTERVKIKDVEE